jgi:4,5-DOPA dioxygenase extradiol
MQRKEFINSMLGLTALSTLSSFSKISEELKEDGQLMPVLFIGHGSPMNAIEDNEFSRGWKAIAKTIPTPKAILMVSAHWETKDTYVTSVIKPETIHDFGGFPKALFDVQYPAPGSKWLADETVKAVHTTKVGLDEAWGLDHGAWSVLKHLYPKADIPVIQLSLDYTKNAQYHYDLAKELYSLRKKGVLIIGSGNMVHNFQYAKFTGDFNAHFGHDWAIEANETFKKLITNRDVQLLINYDRGSTPLRLSAPTPDHYLPMLYSLALGGSNEKIKLFNDAVVGGSFSMTSFMIG